MVRDEEVEVAGPYQVTSLVLLQSCKMRISISYLEEIFIIVILMYPMPSLKHMLDIYQNTIYRIYDYDYYQVYGDYVYD